MLDQLKKLYEETAGKWSVEIKTNSDFITIVDAFEFEIAKIPAGKKADAPDYYHKHKNNALLIVAMHAALPRLLEVATEARKACNKVCISNWIIATGGDCSNCGKYALCTALHALDKEAKKL